MRLIDADTLMQCLGITDPDCTKCGWYKKSSQRCSRGGDFEDACCAIDDAPAIEPERKKGKWIDEGFYADEHGAHAFRCSECGGHIIEYDADPFCKWCGADMRGEDDDIPIEYFENGGI